MLPFLGTATAREPTTSSSLKAFGQSASSVLLLAGVGGCVDAVGFLTLGGLFVSHMSGNSAALGAFVGQGDWHAGLPHLVAILVFVCGLFLGYLVTVRASNPRPLVLLLGLEALLLSSFIAGWTVFGRPAQGTPQYFLLCLPPLLAMGIQNTTLRKLGSATVHTTYVTGVLDAMCEASARAVWGLELPQHPQQTGSEHPPRARDAALASAVTWFCYISGALYGSAALHHVQIRALVPAVAILIWVAIRLKSSGTSHGK